MANEQDESAQPRPKAIKHLTVKQRTEVGKAVRATCPRSSFAAWEPAADRPDPVALLKAQAAERIPELAPIRYGRMLASPFAFYRGAAAIMASDLSTLPNTGLNVQLCGDAHLSNFGGFASPERALVLDINDFDETLPGPWEWDLKRLVASIEIAGREEGFSAKELRKLVLGCAGEYRRSMQEFAALDNLKLWYLHIDLAWMHERWGKTVKAKAEKKLDADITNAHHKDNQRALEKLTQVVDGQVRIVPHPPLIIPIEDLVQGAEREAIETAIQGALRSYRATLRGDRRRLLESYQYTHLARKVVGVGSVGTRNWIALLQGRDDTDALFLQVKEAKASVLEPYLGKSQYQTHGRRVVEGQWLMQASSDIFLGWDQVPAGELNPGGEYYVRQLWDWKISLDIEAMTPDELMIYGKMCAWTLARAHARSGDRIAISAYLGNSDKTDNALAEFAVAYADQNDRDYRALAAAAESGLIAAETGV